MDNEFNKLLKKVNFDDIIAYLLYDTEAEDKRGETYAKRVDNSFNEFFSGIEALYPSASRDNDDLWDIILKFTTLHDEVYFEMGVIIGLQIYKNLEKGSKRIVVDDTTPIHNSIL